jgi:(E)-4-hydroxy-3-methyl-but-2-enyl pyrophosphate reductase
MQIIRAPRFSGFCGGVKRAWSIAARTSANNEGPIYVSGELINNDPAMRELEGKGIQILRVADGETPTGTGTLIMRAHGEGPQSFERAEALGLNVVDATCGIVKVVQQKAVKLEDDGYQVILYGHRNHPESKATIAYTQQGMIIESLEEAEALPHYSKIAGLAQTTALLSEYEKIVEVLKTKADEFVNQGQVCAWTKMAQDEAEQVAAQATVMIVVGGRKSANSHRLVEVCGEHVPSYLVEEVKDIDPTWFTADSIVGIAAGASTREQDVVDVIKQIEAIGTSLATSSTELVKAGGGSSDATTSDPADSRSELEKRA